MAALSLSSTRKKQILVGVLGAWGLVAWFNLALVPQRDHLSTLRPPIEKLRKQLSQTREGLAKLNALEATLAQMKAQFHAPVSIRPPEEQLPELLEVVAKAARGSQVHLLSVKPKQDFSQLSPGPTGYLELPVQVEASAGFHQIGMFLDALEQSENLVQVRELSIQEDPRDLWNHQLSLVLTMYLAAPAPKPAGKARR